MTDNFNEQIHREPILTNVIFSLEIFSLLSRTLLAACADNDVNTVRRLLGDGTNTINEGTDDGESLLSLACSAGYYELAQVSEIVATEKKQPIALNQSNSFEFSQVLLAMQAQVEDRGQKNDCTPLMEAASAGHVEIIKLLISHNADVNAQSSTGNTPLMYACAAGHIEAVKELLAAGANIEDHNENGHTPLMEAASAGHVEVAKVSVISLRRFSIIRNFYTIEMIKPEI